MIREGTDSEMHQLLNTNSSPESRAATLLTKGRDLRNKCNKYAFLLPYPQDEEIAVPLLMQQGIVSRKFAVPSQNRIRDL